MKNMTVNLASESLGPGLHSILFLLWKAPLNSSDLQFTHQKNGGTKNVIVMKYVLKALKRELKHFMYIIQVDECYVR